MAWPVSGFRMTQWQERGQGTVGDFASCPIYYFDLQRDRSVRDRGQRFQGEDANKYGPHCPLCVPGALWAYDTRTCKAALGTGGTVPLLSPVFRISADAMSFITRQKAATLRQPHQLTLWPDDALPGQLPLFIRRAAVQPDGAFPHCNQSCEAITTCLFPEGCGLHCDGVPPDIIKNYRVATRH